MLDDIIKDRLKKERSYPARVKRTHTVFEVLKSFSSFSKSKKKVFIVGRVMGLRGQGALMFLDIQDGSGKMQGVVKKDLVGGDFQKFKANLDLGDFVEIGGVVFKTKSGEKSIEARSARNIVKSLRPLPSVWHGLHDVEERFRKRYLDLLLNSEVKEKLSQRSKIIEYFRQTLYKEGFLEVETPMLQPIPGGAIARPFVTHHNALDIDLYLRIAPELYLKRLLAGGEEKIFEIGRSFRNEGIDKDHNPEFTTIELYWAYQDYRSLMKFVEKLMKKFVPGKWGVTEFTELFKKYANRDWRGLEADELEEIYKKQIRPKVVKPTWVINYPEKIMPLAKLVENNQDLTESFQLIVNGVELVKGFSEMNDPVFQRKQMEEQEKDFRAGNPEASRLDADFLEMLEYGMPPAAGMAIGIDRLVAFATKSHSVKEIIAFPTLRPKAD
ncbi:MAG: lysine--tRNA ligase [Candidatus Harrisonbacteria bacterium RIFCSPLOWO2_02_FULL_41_13b]|uniref:Lysine--tRNA ligase n=1 Tax=Candidatus Harrisonbacteria bacterium RIFCSPLOWO2_02_FULL_41_13b TaxID=1798409 RepID=A0A1G1ZSW5_9BACT|nr:MAG: lysine--tRNA ligase [Candidatus Harrisonbacteria bacterium RIFCSPLOWO2_02_FULL_41_13b]